jgi:hypothetical protein
MRHAFAASDRQIMPVVIDFDTPVANGAFKLAVPETHPYRPQVLGALIDQGRLGTPHGMRAERAPSEPISAIAPCTILACWRAERRCSEALTRLKQKARGCRCAAPIHSRTGGRVSSVIGAVQDAWFSVA